MFGIDDAILGAGAVAAGSAIGGYFGYRGQDEANKANLQSVREQMKFQERMSNTSWQRGVADMRAAGINPMLAFSKGGAPAPGGAAANIQSTTQGIPQATTSALSALRFKSEIANLNADTAVKVANAKNVAAQLPATSAQSAFEAHKYGAADDAIDILKRTVGYDSSVSSAKSAASSSVPHWWQKQYWLNPDGSMKR